MLVADNPLLNILLPKENKALKTVLKEADSKTLQQMPQNKSTSASEIIKNLFNQVKTEGKTNTTIENILKNSSLFKDLGSFSKATTTLLNQIDSNSNLAKFKPLLENFLTDIKNLDANTLKEQLSKSGVFLESNIALSSQKDSTLGSTLGKLLNQLQNIIKDINTLHTKQIDNLITKLIEPNSQNSNTNQLTNMKNLVSLLQNLSTSLADKGTQNLSNLTNQLSSLINKASLVESKIQNSQNLQNPENSQLTESKNTLNTQTKELLSQIKSEVLNNNPQNQTKNLLTQIDSLIKTNDLFLKVENPISSLQTNPSNILNNTNNISTFSNNFASNLSTLLISLKEDIANLSSNQNNSNTQNNLLKVIDKIENILKESIANPNKNPISNDMKSILLQMQDDLASKLDPKSQEMFKQVDKMLIQIDYHQLLSHTGNSNNVYIPFLWDMLEEGSINIKKTDEEKFYCQINLTLKDFGKVDLMMALYDKNKIDLTIHAQREHFKMAVRDNLGNLKKALNNTDLIPVNIKLLDLKDENEKTQVEKKTDAYINPYNNQNTTSVDIRV